MTVVGMWNGANANALRGALRLTNEQFAQQLGTGVRTVAKWNTDPDVVPITEMQRALDTMLSRAPAEVQERFAAIVGAQRPSVPQQRAPEPGAPPTAAQRRLTDDQTVGRALEWLDEHAGWTSGTAQGRVGAQVARIASGQQRDRSQARRHVGRPAVAQALTDFYPAGDGYAPYRVAVTGDPIDTSIITRPEWLDLNLTLGVGNDRSTVTGATATAKLLDQLGAEAAVDRITDSLVSGGRMVDAALYSLRHVAANSDTIGTEFGVTDFLSYALTLDLLENELVDALAAGTAPAPETLPLRARYLPDLHSVTQVDQRLCAGGVVALFAAARPASRRRPGQGDYVFLVQQRSNRTLNANQKLAVIPKAFHQPLVDHTDDAQLSATLEREMEEELFGREDLDDAASQRRADPLHLSRLSAPMRWLVDHTDPDVWRTECTGFGLNLVSGNYEFASLVVVDDESWWEQFGGSIEANWETEGLRSYSTLDRDGIGRLVQDDTWSNEALFALLQGLRRLTEIGGTRVDLPPITLET